MQRKLQDNPDHDAEIESENYKIINKIRSSKNFAKNEFYITMLSSLLLPRFGGYFSAHAFLLGKKAIEFLYMCKNTKIWTSPSICWLKYFAIVCSQIMFSKLLKLIKVPYCMPFVPETIAKLLPSPRSVLLVISNIVGLALVKRFDEAQRNKNKKLFFSIPTNLERYEQVIEKTKQGVRPDQERVKNTRIAQATFLAVMLPDLWDYYVATQKATTA